jgi:O-antigen/teichoic acid export membrane protein
MPGAGVPDPLTAPPGAPEPAVGAVARRALLWSILNNVVGRAGTLLTGIVLARLLVPEDYGVYAVALVALAAVLSMNELGVSLAVVRWPGDVGRIAPTVVTLTWASSAVLYVCCFFAAPAVCRALHAPQATPVLRVLALSVLIDALTAVPAALMTRMFLQRERLVVDSVALVVGSGSAIAFALAGWGAWALVVSMLIGNVVNGIFVWIYAPARYLPGFHADVARELLAFGLPLAVASLLIFALLNLDYVVVGNTLGPTALGFYLLAFNLSAWPVNLFSAPVRRVSMPAFARLHENDSGAGAAYVRACTLLLLVTVPASMLLSLFAEPVIGFLYGDTWVPSAKVLPWLMVLATVRVLGELTYDFLVALGRSRANLLIQVLWLASLAPALVVGAHLGGIVGVGVAHALIALVVVVPAYAVAVRGSGVPLTDILQHLPRPVAGLALSATTALVVLSVVPGRFAQLAVGGVLASAAYVAVVHPMRSLLRAEEPAGDLAGA